MEHATHRQTNPRKPQTSGECKASTVKCKMEGAKRRVRKSRIETWFCEAGPGNLPIFKLAFHGKWRLNLMTDKKNMRNTTPLDPKHAWIVIKMSPADIIIEQYPTSLPRKQLLPGGREKWKRIAERHQFCFKPYRASSHTEQVAVRRTSTIHFFWAYWVAIKHLDPATNMKLVIKTRETVGFWWFHVGPMHVSIFLPFNWGDGNLWLCKVVVVLSVYVCFSRCFCFFPTCPSFHLSTSGVRFFGCVSPFVSLHVVPALYSSFRFSVCFCLYSVSAWRDSDGRGRSRCLIEMLTLEGGILSVKFQIKIYLSRVLVHFDCAGSHETHGASLVCSCFAAFICANFRVQLLLWHVHCISTSQARTQWVPRPCGETLFVNCPLRWFLRYVREKISTAQVCRKHADLCRGLGARHFSYKFLVWFLWHVDRVNSHKALGQRLGHGIFSINFRLECLLWHVHVHFDFGASHKMCA